MAASVDAAAALAVTPPAVEEAGGAVEQARTLIGALNLLSRNLPLPPDVLRAVSSIYHDGGAGDDEEEKGGEREAEKEGNMEMTAAEEGYPVDGATKVRVGGSSGLCGDCPPSVRVLGTAPDRCLCLQLIALLALALVALIVSIWRLMRLYEVLQISLLRGLHIH